MEKRNLHRVPYRFGLNVCVRYIFENTCSSVFDPIERINLRINYIFTVFIRFYYKLQ